MYKCTSELRADELGINLLQITPEPSGSDLSHFLGKKNGKQGQNWAAPLGRWYFLHFWHLRHFLRPLGHIFWQFRPPIGPWPVLQQKMRQLQFKLALKIQFLFLQDASNFTTPDRKGLIKIISTRYFLVIKETNKYLVDMILINKFFFPVGLEPIGYIFLAVCSCSIPTHYYFPDFPIGREYCNVCWSRVQFSLYYTRVHPSIEQRSVKIPS
jgi:hypothetical protein